MSQPTLPLGLPVGTTVFVNTRSNLGIVRDVVRQPFIQFVCLEPYGRNYAAPAVVLTNLSWAFEKDCEVAN